MRILLPALASSLVLAGCFDSSDNGGYDQGNTAPTAVSVDLTTQAETPIMDQLTATDEEGDSLVFAISSEPSKGTVTVQSDGQFTYTPNPEVTGSDSFSFTVDDGTAFAVTGFVNITIEALTVSYNDSVRAAFAQNENDDPLSVNGRAYIQDATDPAAFDDLLTD